MLLAGLSLIFIMVIGTLLFFTDFLGFKADVATQVALLVALMPTTIGALLMMQPNTLQFFQQCLQVLVIPKYKC